MKKLLSASLLAIVLCIVPLTLVGANGDVIWEDTGGAKTLEEGYGVYAETHFWGMYAGWSGTAPLVIVNGKDKDRTFLITIERPSKLELGFEALPEECFSWITISDSLVTASAGETIQVPVTITIPSDIVYSNKHQEVAIQVRETEQGLVQIALQSKWFISTDPYIPIVGGVNTTLVIVIAIAALGGGCGVYLLMRRRSHAKK
jgi:hypothetical protein